jgi:toxin ParE1/3/4
MPERRYRVVWAGAATHDLEEIVEHIAAESPVNARSVLRRISDRAAALEVSPGRGRVVPELAGFGINNFREIVVRPYRLMYRVDGHTVSVLAVFDGRRDIEDVLLARLVRVRP